MISKLSGFGHEESDFKRQGNDRVAGGSIEASPQSWRIPTYSVRPPTRYAKEGEALFDLTGRGGRHPQHMSVQQEAQLLAPFTEKAKAGGLLHVSEIKRALEKQVGSTVAASTVYRMLDRHDWRKVVTRPRHPKADRAAQDAFKKTPHSGTQRGRTPG